MEKGMGLTLTRCVALVLGLVCASPAMAIEKPPKEQLRYDSLTVARLNPLGLISRNDMTYRWRLFDSDSDIAKNNYFGVGALMVVSPAFFRVGPTIEFQPLSIFEVSVAYETFSYFGTFDFAQSFQFVEDDFSDSALDAIGDDPEQGAYSTFGTQFTLTSIFRFKVGPIAARNTFRLMQAEFDIREGDQLLYDPVWDLLIPNGGWFMNNDVDLLVFIGERLKLGARWTFATSFYRDRDFNPGGPGEDINGATNRVGPAMTYTFPSKSKLFKDPTLVVVANWWVEHRFRTGEDVSTAFPYFIAGLSFSGDLWTSEVE